MKYKTTVTYIAAITVKKTRIYSWNFSPKRFTDYTFTNVLAEIETKKWPWSKPVTGCEVFVHNSHWGRWRVATTLERVSKSVADQLEICLRCYVEGANDA